MMGIVRAGNGTILSHMGPETGWSKGEKWKRFKLGKDQLVLTKRWHKGHNRWHKRLWLSCQTSHTALAGLVYRGAGGLSRAQTVQVLANSLALEIVILCMQYSVSSEVLEINLVTTVTASLFAALVCIPSMTIFAAAFNPQIVVNLLKVVATCPGKAWRNRKAILYGLCCCPCKAWGQAVQLVNARATRTTVRARWRKARRRLKLFAGMAAPAPHQMERDCDVESTSAQAAPAKNTSIIKVRPAPSKHTPVSPASSPSSPSCSRAVWCHLVTGLQALKPAVLQVYRQAVEAERKEQLLEKHRNGYVAGDTETDLAARLRERRFEYASLNQHLLMLSLTRAVRMREWHHASRIALGWLLNLCAFVGMLCIYVVYGCTVRSLSAEDNSQVPEYPLSNYIDPVSPAALWALIHDARCMHTQAFVNSWLLSIAQRFLAMEPIIILVGRPRHAAHAPPYGFTFVSVDPLAVTCHLSPRHHHRHRRHLPLHYLPLPHYPHESSGGRVATDAPRQLILL